MCVCERECVLNVCKMLESVFMCVQVLLQRPLGFQGRIFESIRQIEYVKVAALHFD